LEVAEAEGLAVDQLCFVVKALGYAVVAGEAPHGSDLRGPGVKGLAELDPVRQAGLAYWGNGAQGARRQLLAAGEPGDTLK
jgi:hypothetical protein